MRNLLLVAMILLAAATLAGCDVTIPPGSSAYAHPDRASRLAAICDPANPKACDDGNPCTDEQCDGVTGCHYTANTVPCNDADPCTVDDVCAANTCAGKPLNCDDGNPCTADSCKPESGCVGAAIPGTCDDGDPCTDKDACATGACAGTPHPCNDDNPCTVDSCDSTAKPGAEPCRFKPTDGACDDGNPCTIADTCKTGACQGEAKVCDDGNPCTDDSCDPKKGCQTTDNAAPCGADNVCASGQTCAKGTCGGGKAKVCADNNPCTDDSCDPKTGCVFAPNTTPCDDGDKCTIKDACKAGKCVGGKNSCDDGNSCTTDNCTSATGCDNVVVLGPCDDGDPCTATGSCVGSKCTATSDTCTTDQPCRTAVCAPKTGDCSVKMAVDGTPCAGLTGKCSAGACISNDAKKKLKWGYVPAGTFWMGCNSALDKSCKSDEQPQHLVTVSKPYWMLLDEVTVASYLACVQTGACKPASQFDSSCNSGKAGRELHPVNCVLWSDAQAFCKWAGGALPTEAQWEMAARGRCDENGGIKGCKLAMRTYPWGEQTPACGVHGVVANSNGSGCGKGITWPVGTGSKSGAGPYGMRDLAGNVWEWVADWRAGYTTFSVVHPTGGTGAASGTVRVARGGSLTSSVVDIRGARRGAGAPSSPTPTIGFRCVKPAN